MLGRKSLLIVLNNVLGAMVGFLALNFIAGMPVGSYGYYVWAGSSIGIFALITSLGFNQAHIKRISEGLDEARANGTFYLVKIVLTFAFVILVIGAYALWRFVLQQRFVDSTTDEVYLIVLMMYTLLSFRQFYDATFQAHRHTARGESVMLIDTLATFAGVTTVFYLVERTRGHYVPLRPFFDWIANLLNVGDEVSAAAAGALLASAYLGGKMVSLVYAALQFHLHRYPIGKPSLTIYRDYRSFGLHMAIIGGITVLYGNIDRFLLGYWWNEVSVENFQVTYQVLTPMLFVAMALSNLLFPSFSNSHAKGDRDGMMQETRLSERYMSMLIVPQIALALVFAREAMHIFNDRFIPSAHLVQIFTIFVFFTTIASPSRSLLLGTGQTRRILRLVGINLGLILVLNVILVHPDFLAMAETGAAIAIAIVSLVTYATTKHYARQTLPVTWIPDGTPRHLLAGALVALACWSARNALGAAAFERVWQLVLTGGLAGLLYLALLVALKEFRRSDWDFLRDLIHPRKMAGYVGRELTPKSKP